MAQQNPAATGCVVRGVNTKAVAYHCTKAAAFADLVVGCVQGSLQTWLVPGAGFQSCPDCLYFLFWNWVGHVGFHAGSDQKHKPVWHFCGVLQLYMMCMTYLTMSQTASFLLCSLLWPFVVCSFAFCVCCTMCTESDGFCLLRPCIFKACRPTSCKSLSLFDMKSVKVLVCH